MSKINQSMASSLTSSVPRLRLRLRSSSSSRSDSTRSRQKENSRQARARISVTSHPISNLPTRPVHLNLLPRSVYSLTSRVLSLAHQVFIITIPQHSIVYSPSSSSLLQPRIHHESRISDSTTSNTSRSTIVTSEAVRRKRWRASLRYNNWWSLW